jgi:cellulose synthase/poly-beta-1,6-N-acetylglucosamine synthase-like glycosyltransferase
MNLPDLFIVLVLAALAVPSALACLYLLAQTLLSARLPDPPPSARQLRFDIVVPAHNEAAGISHTVANLRRIDWPTDRYRILVVADNCIDATASLAAAAGAVVLERRDPTLRGKGYALKFAFERSHADRFADAVVVVDADSEVSTNLLEAFAARIERGADALQAHHGVLRAEKSWRTRLLAIAIGAYHVVRSRARERMGVSCGIRGNGWCVTHRLLDQVSYNAFSLAEDLEYGISLGLAGFRVYYAGEAEASQDMTVSQQAARTQRQRWERGRFLMIRSRTLPLLRAALQRRSAVCLDLALDLLVLPFTYVALGVGALFLAAVLAAWLHAAFIPWVWFSAGCILVLFAYVLRGWQLSDTGARGLLDLLGAPAFVTWKLAVMILSRRKSGEWIRTERARHEPNPP